MENTTFSLKDLSILDWEQRCSQTSMRPDYVPKNKYTDKTSAGLEKAICRFLTLKGYQAERIKNTGVAKDNTKIVQDHLGFTRKIGSIEWRKGTGTNGTADVSATVKGKSLKIEVKIGKDKQSDEQIEYQESIIRSGGLYWIAKDWAGFYSQYVNEFC